MKEYQLDPIDHKPAPRRLLRRSRWTRRSTVTVPIVLKGEPKGVKQQGGIVDFVNREIEIECLPGDIPEHIIVDVCELMLHQGIRVRDLDAEDGEVEADERGRHDDRPRRRPLKAEEPAPDAAAAAATRRRLPSPKSSRRARQDKEDE